MNQLSDRERQEGWCLLWDGKTTTGWRGASLDHFPDTGWSIADGILTVEGTGGNIVTTESYSNFELVVDFRLTKGANSGIKYMVQSAPNQVVGLEYQLIDDKRHPDAAEGVGGNRTLASLYDLIPATNLSETSRTDKRVRGPGAWNRARIVVDGAYVEHWLNGVKVVEYERGTQLYRALIAKSKYHIFPYFGEAKAGAIMLQEHEDEVSFRNMKIREWKRDGN